MKRLIRSQEGCTLLELILVVLLIGITAALVLPRGINEGVTSSALDSEAAKIAGFLRLARQKAMSTASPFRVDFSDGSYSLYEVSSGQTAENVEKIDGHLQAAPNFGSGGDSWVIFTASGTAEQTGTVTLSEKSTSTTRRIIRVYTQGNIDIETH
ncbi:MAG TPA: GspH/FimT family protein [Desulfobacteria bacterium]|nr:GspH/FimT family protein [Desulfobacteria bacterium]